MSRCIAYSSPQTVVWRPSYAAQQRHRGHLPTSPWLTPQEASNFSSAINLNSRKRRKLASNAIIEPLIAGGVAFGMALLGGFGVMGCLPWLIVASAMLAFWIFLSTALTLVTSLVFTAVALAGAGLLLRSVLPQLTGKSPKELQDEIESRLKKAVRGGDVIDVKPDTDPDIKSGYDDLDKDLRDFDKNLRDRRR